VYVRSDPHNHAEKKEKRKGGEGQTTWNGMGVVVVLALASPIASGHPPPRPLLCLSPAAMRLLSSSRLVIFKQVIAILLQTVAWPHAN
jgi:hypothetical protein